MGMCSTVYAKDAVKLNRKSVNLTVGSSAKLRLNYSGNVSWSVSSKSKASVKKVSGNTAVVTAKKTGIVTVKAKAGGKTYSCKVTIKAPSPQLNKKSITLYKGKTYDLQLLNSNGAVKWSTSNKSRATVKKLSKNKARVTAKKNGTVKITAKVGKKSYTCMVKVITYVKTKSAKVTVSGNLVEGNKAQAIVSIQPSNASNKKVTWRSSDTGIATIDANGNISLKRAGTVTITCETADGTVGSAEITVQAKPVPQQPQTEAPVTETPVTEAPRPPQTETVPPKSESDTEVERPEQPATEPESESDETELKVEQVSDTIKVVGLPENTMNVGDMMLLAASTPDGTPLIWESADPSVATVTEDGKVICSGKGVADLSCTTEDGKSGATVTFVVKEESKPALIQEWEDLE